MSDTKFECIRKIDGKYSVVGSWLEWKFIEYEFNDKPTKRQMDECVRKIEKERKNR